jgi:hypothetical protein
VAPNDRGAFDWKISEGILEGDTRFGETTIPELE